MDFKLTKLLHTTIKKLARFNSKINTTHYLAYLLYLIDPKLKNRSNDISIDFIQKAKGSVKRKTLSLKNTHPQSSLKKEVKNAGNTFDPEDQAKHAAMGVAVMSSNLLLGYRIDEVSKKGTRGDFYLGNPSNNYFMEVSGTSKDQYLDSRTQTKIKQIKKSKVAKKSWISVTSFEGKISNFIRVK